jgi:hypothetical protein
MRKAFSVFMLTMFFVLSADRPGISQTIAGTEENIKNLLCNKWKMAIMEVQGVTQKMPADNPMYFSFKKDGTVSLTAAGESHNEYWSYDHNTKTIFIQETKTIETKDEFKIVKINDQELVLKINSDGLISTMYFVLAK